MSVWLWTVLPLAALHLWAWHRSRELLRCQLLLDLVIGAVLGPALLLGADLSPVRCLSRNPPFDTWRWSHTTAFQPTQSDVTLQFHPWMEESRRQLAAGRLPLISDRIGGGLPLLANGQSGLWSPLNLPVWLLGAEAGTTVMAFWKLELAGLGAFLLLWRGLRFRRFAAETGALAFAGGAYIVGWLLVPMAWVIAALPWAWWVAIGAVRGRRRVLRIVAGGVFFGWLLGCGLHPETAAVVIGSAILAGLALHPLRWIRLTAMMVVAVVVTAALAWPTLRYISASEKRRLLTSESPNRERPPFELRRAAVQQLLIPLAHGHPGRGDWRASYPYSAVAAGVGGLVLGLLAVGRPRRRRRRLALAAWAQLAVAAVLVYRLPPLDGWLVRLPPISSMTLPRFGVLLAWSLAVLAALTVEGLLAGRRRAWPWWAATTGLMAVVAAISSPWRLRPVDGLLVLSTVLACAAARRLADRPHWLGPLIAVELALYAVGINPIADPADRLPVPPMVARLVELQGTEGGRILGLGGVFPANLASRYGLPDLRAYDPLRPVPFVRMMAALGDPNPGLGGPLRRAPAGMCGAWSVRFLVTPPAAQPAGWEAAWRSGGGAIWRNPKWLPEVRVALRTVAVEGNAGWRLLAADGIDFRDEVLVAAPGVAAAAAVAELEDVDSGASSLHATVLCDGPCVLVVARPWAPGWRAAVDGVAAEVVRTNLAGLGAVVPAGRHHVELSYNPWRW